MPRCSWRRRYRHVGAPRCLAVAIGRSTATLTVTDSTTSKSVCLTLAGDYSDSTWTVTSDGHGGAAVVDPPATPSGSTVVAATGSDQTLTGTGPSDTFVFNFANVGQATVTNFHADSDLLQIK